MKALVVEDQLRFEPNYPVPRPGTGQALIRVHLAGICATDLQVARGYMDFRGVPGHEFVGEVVEGSSEWLGRRVVGEINCVCRTCDMCSRGLSNHCRQRTVLGIQGMDGAFAEFVVLPESNLHEVPAALSDEEAVFAEPLAAALQVLKQCPVEPRMQVAVLGSGRLGLLVAQVVQRSGCRLRVIGRNPRTLDFCDRHRIEAVPLADVVAREDHDVVVDCTGNPEALALAVRLVRPRGTIVMKSTHTSGFELNLTPVVVQEICVLGSRCGPLSEALSVLASGQVDVRTMISKVYGLSDGGEAFTASADANNIKVLLKPTA